MFEQIYAVVRTIPHGNVASYGAVAQASGLFRGARVVGWAMKALPEGTDVPWQRVVNQEGVISIINQRIPAYRQAEALREEGIAVEEHDGQFIILNPPWHTFTENE